MKIELMINSQEIQIIQAALPSVKYLCQQKKKSKIFQDLYNICILWYSWVF